MRALRCNAVAVAAYSTLPRVRGRIALRPTAYCLHNPSPFSRSSRIAPFSTVCHNRGTVTAEPTIYALATGPGQAAIAIVRISGRACINIYNALCPKKALPPPRHASVRSIYEPSASASPAKSLLLDSSALVLYFPAPKTATGEDILELHVHGGPAVVSAVLNAIGKCSTTSLPVRYADPGEFTRRGFLNDRLDLTQVEALGDMLSAVTEEQRRISVQGTRGGLATRYESWRQLLLAARGELEALIDFSEDQHFDESPGSLVESVAVKVRFLAGRIEYHAANAVRGELLRNGISMSLIGAPNAGKSSLLNLIVGRNAAIVSREAGTTRDVVEIALDLGGFFCRLGDTAGLRQSSASAPPLGQGTAQQDSTNVVGDVEMEGIRRAKERAEQSDLVILVLSVEPSIEDQGAQLLLDAEVLRTATQLLNMGKTVVVAINKIDNYSPGTDAALMAAKLVFATQTVLPGVPAARIFCLSCREAESEHPAPSAYGPQRPTTAENASAQDRGNLQSFLTGLRDTFRSLTSPLVPTHSSHSRSLSASASASDTSTADDTASGPPDPSMWQESLGATQRQRALLEECVSHLHDFLGHANPDPASDTSGGDDHVDIVAAAEALRAAAACLAKIQGRGDAGDVEEVLGVVFEK